jgi:hypothetical protein
MRGLALLGVPGTVRARPDGFAGCLLSAGAPGPRLRPH